MPPKLLKEIVEKLFTPYAKVLNLSLEEGIVPSEWKEANITPEQVRKLQTSEFNISFMLITRNIRPK